MGFIDGAAYADCTSPVEYANLADGQQEFRARAIDPFGNILGFMYNPHYLEILAG